MTGQDLWFEPVDLLSRCSLNEALLWVWAQRVPVNNVYREESAFATLQDWECEHLNIPPVPKGVERAAHYRTEERVRKKLDAYGRKMPKASVEYQVSNDMKEAEGVRHWLSLVTTAMELPTTELFLKLRRGEIEAMGKLLRVGAEIIDFVEQNNPYGSSDFDDLIDSPIPHDCWTIRGIDWLSNAVITKDKCYCDVSMSVETIMNLFPCEHTPVDGAEFVGNLLLVRSLGTVKDRPPLRKTPGRPPTFAWEAFHVEVADLIRRGQMPEKKEAAIQQMMSWFEGTQRQRPSRSAVSEKLTAYYRRFFADKN